MSELNMADKYAAAINKKIPLLWFPLTWILAYVRISGEIPV